MTAVTITFNFLDVLVAMKKKLAADTLVVEIDRDDQVVFLMSKDNVRAINAKSFADVKKLLLSSTDGSIEAVAAEFTESLETEYRRQVEIARTPFP